MTLDEAIIHCEEKEKEMKERGFDYNTQYNYETVEGTKCYKCAEDHKQLAEWLKELKAHREAWSKLKNDVVAYHNNYDYDSAMHFLNIIDTRLSEIGSGLKELKEYKDAEVERRINNDYN